MSSVASSMVQWLHTLPSHAANVVVVIQRAYRAHLARKRSATARLLRKLRISAQVVSSHGGAVNSITVIAALALILHIQVVLRDSDHWHDDRLCLPFNHLLPLLHWDGRIVSLKLAIEPSD